ncbi:MAG: helicase-exonuclease AddAB subunit AddA [Sedimentisphaerales bacterium]|jgi:ATP-dependent helicase/nuclease subunit A
MSQKNVNPPRQIKWTTQQSRAIVEHARNVFVSASAGTGKTAVLSASCVDVVKNASACPDVWGILVVTFTDMAAEQMRSRIAQQLNAAIEAAKDQALRRHLRRQLVLLSAADVSTIHSFCKRLITEHFHELGLDPTFRVIDADESALLKTESLEKTIDWAWNQLNLADAMRQLLARRNLRISDGFPATIIAISDFLDGVVSRDDWLSRAQLLAGATNPFDTDLARTQRQIIEGKLQDALGRIEYALKIYQQNNQAGPWAAKCRRDYIGPVRQLLDLLRAGDWDTAASAIIAFDKPMTTTPKDVPSDLAGLIQKMVKASLDSVEELNGLAVLNPEYLNKLAGAVGSQTMVLIELVRQFDRLYAQTKKSLNCLDFADLEHYALRLLTNQQTRKEKLEPSETAIALREKYKYVFVDEYQDINGVQQAILDMISTPANLFAVGDPKQSIYQWRGARPEIFLEHLKQSQLQPKTAKAGLRVDLNVNFRSAKPILDFVNLVFARIMTASFAGVDYDQSAHLHPASQDDAGKAIAPAVELHILDEASDVAEEDDEQTDSGSPGFSARQLEAAMIASRIKQIVGADTAAPAMQIFDKKTGSARPVEYSDVVILMRSLAGKNDFVEALRLSGIPVSSEATAGYFETTEITDVLSLLKVLDNPRRDIELAAVLRSPFFSFTDTELAKIRLYGKKDNRNSGFYDCVRSFCESGDDRGLTDKITSFLVAFDEWRTIARRGRLAELIWHIYRRTGYLSFVCALPDGLARRANLLKLHDRAVQFEGFASSSGVPSLTRFVEFIEKLVAAGEDWSKPEPESPAGNVVRLLSIHKSKGLEFPVVFVADLDGEFNKKDAAADCLVDEQSTLGLRVIDPDDNSRLDSMGWQVITERARRKSLAEEMRILYVAMTRAMDRLVLVGRKDSDSCRRILTASLLFGDSPVPHWYLASCKSHLDWILSALGRHPLLHNIFQTGQSIQSVGDDLFSVHFYDHPQLAQLAAQLSSLVCRSSSKRVTSHEPRATTLLARLKQSLNWQYPFPGAPGLPAKRSVSQWTHRNDEFVKLDYSASLGRMPKSILLTEQIDGRTIGTATHLVISQLDLDKPITTDAINRLTTKLVADGAITQSVASQINAESIIKFFKTELGKETLGKNNLVWREWPFTFAVPASQWSEPAAHQTSDDYIIVQGIIDLLIKTPKGLLIVDFKTDNVSADQAPQRAELYRPQLALYAQAAAAITGQKTLSKWLYFLTPALAIEV